MGKSEVSCFCLQSNHDQGSLNHCVQRLPAVTRRLPAWVCMPVYIPFWTEVLANYWPALRAACLSTWYLDTAVYISHAPHSVFEALSVKHNLVSQNVTFIKKNYYLYVHSAIVFLFATMKTYLNHELVTKDGWQTRTQYFILEFKQHSHVQFAPNLAYLGYLLYCNEKGTQPHNATIISPL
jgi:hypothetical protein